MHQTAVEDDHRSRRPLGRDDAALQTTGFLDHLRDALIVDGPQRIAGGRGVMAGFQHALLVAARNEHQRPVELVGVV